jgi:hypothetical protein
MNERSFCNISRFPKKLIFEAYNCKQIYVGDVKNLMLALPLKGFSKMKFSASKFLSALAIKAVSGPTNR